MPRLAMGILLSDTQVAELCASGGIASRPFHHKYLNHLSTHPSRWYGRRSKMMIENNNALVDGYRRLQFAD